MRAGHRRRRVTNVAGGGCDIRQRAELVVFGQRSAGGRRWCRVLLLVVARVRPRVALEGGGHVVRLLVPLDVRRAAAKRAGGVGAVLTVQMQVGQTGE